MLYYFILLKNWRNGEIKLPKLDTLDMKVLGYFLPYDPFLEPQTKTPSWQQILGPCFFYQEIKRNKLNLSQYVISVINKQAWETFKFAALFSDIDLEAAFASRPSKWLAVAFSTLAALLTSTLISSIVIYESNNHHWLAGWCLWIFSTCSYAILLSRYQVNS